jgi:hypothetical protein
LNAGVIQVDDVTGMAHGLNSAVLSANKLDSAIYQYNEELPDGTLIRKMCKVHHFGVTCDLRDLQKAVNLLTRIINHAYAVDSNQVKGFLGNPISKIDLAFDPKYGPTPRCAVVTYIAVDDETSLIMQEDFDGVSFNEGDILTDLEDFK